MAALLVSAASVRAAQLVSEGVTFDSITHLYTYHYAVDNRAGTEAVIEIEVLIIPNAGLYQLPPLLHTSPPNWQFVTSFGGLIIHPPAGTFQQWYNPTGVPPGEYLSGFSFSTPYGPVTSPTPNYQLFKVPSDTFDDGIVAAPQLPPRLPAADAPVFGPAILLLLAIALGTAGALTMRA
jgi:hypothetical protein